jgi:C4-dicarboxylate-specific signal transduction histidine kinase
MATGLAHELRQPLTIMSLAAQNLQKLLAAGKTEGITQRVQRIVDQSARAGNIIEHLRRFARGSDQGEPPGPVALGDAVEGAMTLVGGSLRDAEVELVVDIPSTAPDVLGHLVGLEQVLVNLTMNACHALEARPPGLPRRITIGLGDAAPEGMVEIQVRDTGGGIAPQVMSRLFEPFVTTKGAEKGTGLGLSICHGLISAMGGTIRATNQAEGAVFSITLKAVAADQPPRTETSPTSQVMSGSNG